MSSVMEYVNETVNAALAPMNARIAANNEVIHKALQHVIDRNNENLKPVRDAIDKQIKFMTEPIERKY